MTASLKRSSILIGLVALMASPALAGMGGGGRVKGGGSDGCVQYGFAAEQLDDPAADYAARITLSVADSCDSKRRGIEGGEAAFSVRIDGQDACPEQTVSFDDLGSLEYSCELRLNAEDLPAQLEACVRIDADERDGKQLSQLQGGKCTGIDLDVLPGS